MLGSRRNNTQDLDGAASAIQKQVHAQLKNLMSSLANSVEAVGAGREAGFVGLTDNLERLVQAQKTVAGFLDGSQELTKDIWDSFNSEFSDLKDNLIESFESSQNGDKTFGEFVTEWKRKNKKELVSDQRLRIKETRDANERSQELADSISDNLQTLASLDPVQELSESLPAALAGPFGPLVAGVQSMTKGLDLQGKLSAGIKALTAKNAEEVEKATAQEELRLKELVSGISDVSDAQVDKDVMTESIENNAQTLKKIADATEDTADATKAMRMSQLLRGIGGLGTAFTTLLKSPGALVKGFSGVLGKGLGMLFKGGLKAVPVLGTIVAGISSIFDVADMSNEEIDKMGGFIPALLHKFGSALTFGITEKFTEWSQGTWVGDMIGNITGFIVDGFMSIWDEDARKRWVANFGEFFAEGWALTKDLFKTHLMDPLSDLSSKALEFLDSQWDRITENITRTLQDLGILDTDEENRRDLIEDLGTSLRGSFAQDGNLLSHDTIDTNMLRSLAKQNSLSPQDVEALVDSAVGSDDISAATRREIEQLKADIASGKLNTMKLPNVRLDAVPQEQAEAIRKLSEQIQEMNKKLGIGGQPSAAPAAPSMDAHSRRTRDITTATMNAVPVR